ncbi:uncharacterized protein LOC141723844 [Apium graveolens]|uniref:uncharacterized protein LOC141723844 n=1 Tax=Apium graveolens TaxID=4045 RepID=UPI003D7A4309
MANNPISLQFTQHYHQQIEHEFDDLYTHSLNYNLHRFNYNTSLSTILPDPADLVYISGHESDDADSVSDMNYVTNLFENRLDCVRNDENNNQDSNFMGVNENLNHRAYGSDQDGEEELGFELGGLEGGMSGLRVVDIDSESDVEEVEEIGEIDGGEWFSGNRNCVRIDNWGDGGGLNEEIWWDEVDGDREGFSSGVRVNSDNSWEEDDSVDIEDDIEDENFRDLEWEILLAANNFSGEFEVENDDGVLYVMVQDEYLYAQTESALKGSPPAAKSVVENLVSVVLTKDYVKENNVVCAVCKDEIGVEERATRLPCSHHYHGECIVPWLNMRNTCPVCRFELPTDDADYERRKERRDGLGWLDDLNVRYDQ